MLTTFNDYQDDASMNLMQIHINEGHGWQNQLIRDVNLPEGSLAMLIRRQDETIIPKGDTRILAGDEVVLNVPAYESVNDIELREITIDKDHPWNGCRIEDLDLEDHVLVAMIKREDRNIIPKGQTKIQEGDVVVVYN
ncbi:TrkA C-terminal domain-containing protein [Anaerostipes sp.]|uniref:TrkA C-terminal domain-containing protein n=1 Tax=Anaerostipes sp. TaxID=1872530 RepID=UPI00257D5C77|nr:TrkA C-terminal domain-containing protein [Anaerostipes sp.]